MGAVARAPDLALTLGTAFDAVAETSLSCARIGIPADGPYEEVRLRVLRATREAKAELFVHFEGLGLVERCPECRGERRTRRGATTEPCGACRGHGYRGT